MSKKRKIVYSVVSIAVVGGAAFLFFGNSKSSADEQLPRVKVQFGSVTDKALAVGTIEPENEFPSNRNPPAS